MSDKLKKERGDFLRDDILQRKEHNKYQEHL